MVILVRVDDRLIHGQVVEGWLRVIQAQRIVVASDSAATDAFQKGLMRLAVPDSVALDVWTVARTVEFLRADAKAVERVLLLVPGVKELSVLVEAGAPIRAVNLGGVHDGPGRRMAAPHISLSDEERRIIARLLSRHIEIETRALPTDAPESIEKLVPDLPRG